MAHKRTFMPLLMAFICFSPSIVLRATETDNFIPHVLQLADSAEKLDEFTRFRLEQARIWANTQDHCVGKTLRAGVWKFLSGNLWAKLETDIEALDMFDKSSPTINQSVYQYLDLADSLVVGIGVIKLGSSIRFGNFRIGSDKFGHFMAEGNHNFQEAFMRKKGVEAALSYNVSTERGQYGSMTTAVYSFGDTVANFSGMIFWAKLTPEYADQDPFKGDPYFICQNNQWVQNRRFTWRDYVDGAWDEAINCSAFRSELIKDKVYMKIHRIADAVSQATGKTVKLDCPILPQECYNSVLKYKQFAPYLIHPSCFNAAREIHRQRGK